MIGVYLALALCCDEKSQCQAPERAQPGLPLDARQIRTRTHDYYRHGMITLFAALKSGARLNPASRALYSNTICR